MTTLVNTPYTVGFETRRSDLTIHLDDFVCPECSAVQPHREWEHEELLYWSNGVPFQYDSVSHEFGCVKGHLCGSLFVLSLANFVVDIEHADYDCAKCGDSVTSPHRCAQP